jgi:processive 1,2-diacylglycerol beta-glucosyltransferase
MGALDRLDGRVDCHGVDSFTHTYPVVSRVVARTYLEMLNYAPKVWDYLYDNPAVAEATESVRGVLNAFSIRKYFELMKRFRPRALVCTQAVPITVLAALKGRGRIKVPLAGVVTDYDVHRYWLSPHVDLYLVANEDIKRRMVREGIREERVRVTGIPVDPHFAQVPDRAGERLRLGLHPEKPTVLISGGSRGLGPLDETVAALKRAGDGVQILAVCGHNERARRALQARYEHDRSVRVFGFTRAMPRLMDAADVLVSKPGGLTCAESLAKGLPLIMIRPIPGQEERNADYLMRHGAAERADTLERLVLLVHDLTRDPERIARLRRRALALARPHAAFDAAQAILKLLRF